MSKGKWKNKRECKPCTGHGWVSYYGTNNFPPCPPNTIKCKPCNGTGFTDGKLAKLNQKRGSHGQRA